jgi:hypothetical protein
VPPGTLESPNGSVLARQQKGRCRAIGFGDDPDLHAPIEVVGGEDTQAAAQGELVLTPIIRTEVSSIAALVPGE